MVRGPNGRRQRYVPRMRRRRRGLQRGARLPLLANGSLAFVAQEIQTKSPYSTPGLTDDPNEKPSRLLWIGTNNMKRPCVHGVEITCKRIIMANCVAGVEPFLP